MPKIPEYNHKPLKPIYNSTNPNEPASLKQKSLLDTLYRRRKIDIPDMSKLTKGKAAELISSMLDTPYWD